MIQFALICMAHQNGVGPFPTQQAAQQVLDKWPDEGDCQSEIIPLYEPKPYHQDVSMPFSLN